MYKKGKKINFPSLIKNIGICILANSKCTQNTQWTILSDITPGNATPMKFKKMK